MSETPPESTHRGVFYRPERLDWFQQANKKPAGAGFLFALFYFCIYSLVNKCFSIHKENAIAAIAQTVVKIAITSPPERIILNTTVLPKAGQIVAQFFPPARFFR